MPKVIHGVYYLQIKAKKGKWNKTQLSNANDNF